MAAGDWIDEGINTYVRDLITPKLHSVYTEAKPLLAWLAGSSVAGKDTLGDPNVGVMFGGKDLDIGEKSTLAGAKTHTFRYQKAQTDEAEVVTAGGDTPVSTVFAEDNVGTAGVNFVHFWNPLRIREDSLLNAANNGMTDSQINLTIANVVEEAVGQGWQRALEKQQAQLWAGTLNSTSQDKDVQSWDDYIGVTHWCDDGVKTAASNYVGGVDRTAQTQLKGNVLDADVDFASTTVSLGMLREARMMDSFDSATLPNGAIGKRYTGAGNLIITTPEIWLKIADLLDAKNQINSNDIVPFVRAGFKGRVALMDDAVVAYDHSVPSGEIYLLTPDFWLFEIQKGANFEIMPWTRKWMTEEGGAYYRWTQIHAKTRLVCRRPDLQVKIVDVTA